jgi:prophage regulatory protein
MRTLRMLRWPQVQEITGLSRSTIWRLEGRGAFPARRQLGGNSVAWRADEVEDWITQRPVVGGGETGGGGDGDDGEE